MNVGHVQKTQCTGCAACSAVCPKNCITMTEDDEGGFLYPFVNELDCVDCGLCTKTCHTINFNFILKDEIKSYIGIASKDEVNKSASGGASAMLIKAFIKKGGIVYGSVFTPDLNVVHRRVDTISEAEYFRKSKYIQSDTLQCYSSIEEDLKNGLNVLFTGTSCQCASVHKYLDVKRANKDNLYTINVLCHGVPSQHLFNVYRKEQEDRVGSKMVSYTFRNKVPVNGGVNSRSAEIHYANGRVDFVGISDDPFLKMYYSKLAYRPSCMNCKYACSERVADITLADAWKIETIMSDLNPLTGISLILHNSKKGGELLSNIDSSFTLKEIDTSWALQSQKLFRTPTKCHKNRDLFLKAYKNDGFKNAVDKLLAPSISIKIKRYLKNIIG